MTKAEFNRRFNMDLTKETVPIRVLTEDEIIERNKKIDSLTERSKAVKLTLLIMRLGQLMVFPAFLFFSLFIYERYFFDVDSLKFAVIVAIFTSIFGGTLFMYLNEAIVTYKRIQARYIKKEMDKLI